MSFLKDEAKRKVLAAAIAASNEADRESNWALAQEIRRQAKIIALAWDVQARTIEGLVRPEETKPL